MATMTRNSESAGARYLGIEGGGTRTVALLADSSGETLRRLETGPANMKLLTAAQLTRHFRSIVSAVPSPDALGIGLSGAWVEARLPEDPLGCRQGLARDPLLRY